MTRNFLTKRYLVFSIFNTKTKPKHRLFCHPFFAKNIYPEIIKRNPNSTAEDYLLFPHSVENRQKIYHKISKTFTRLSKELNLYYRGGSTRPLYSIRHTFAKNNYIAKRTYYTVIAKQMNTSERMLHSAYLDDDDILLSDELNKLQMQKKIKIIIHLLTCF